MNTVELDLGRLVLALGLMVIALGLSFWQRLGLEWSLAVATGRTILQLLVVGYVLEFVFALNQPWAVGLVLLVLLTVAALEARNRIGKEVPMVLPLVWSSIFLGTLLPLLYTLLLVIQPGSLAEPQWVIPLAAVVLGNALNGAAIAGEHLTQAISRNRVEVETHLSLGATPEQAVAQYRREAIRMALIPTLNAMMVIGVVTLPGFLAGELLGGVRPVFAVGYQMLIMFILALATLITTLLLTQGLYRQYFNQAQQLILP
ncbi:ABC transporter permease [Leptolyngbya sp. FACHB-261]|uniref:ABC transporter permease n=1 Tax=Leptolyngbya sp. FACHB-261 TaxID=2692806 RepID=UPI001686594E|nr:iron export ABC transporter permease subunit FetB [Leptolyngbya sp. FACHB-261]MBD2099451.1 iron export ABC transporter permease subunit FetB [Leptolyngbya sp. FACHB-261]